MDSMSEKKHVSSRQNEHRSVILFNSIIYSNITQTTFTSMSSNTDSTFNVNLPWMFYNIAFSPCLPSLHLSPVAIHITCTVLISL